MPLRALAPQTATPPCPWCATAMRPERKNGVTFEVCKHCGSVWLDAGEFPVVQRALIGRGTLPPAMGGQHQSALDWFMQGGDPAALFELVGMVFNPE